MLFAKADKVVVTKEGIEDKLINYFRKRIQKINVLSFFYNTPSIFEKVMSYALAQKKTVLYITNELKENISLAKYLSSVGYKLNYINYEFEGISRDKINICTHNRALYLSEKFDLIIYDDVNSIPIHEKEGILRLLEHLSSSYGTMIAYSIEEIFDDGVTLFHPINNNGRPLIEPRIINTRINVNEDLPLVIYDYISWSIFSGKKVIIYVPDDEKVENINNYLLNFKDQLTKNIYIYNRTKKDKTNIEKFRIAAKGIIITDCFEQEEMDLQEINVMVFFADNEVFNYKKLVYLTSRANRCLSESREEVIFLSNETNEAIDKAKDILRELNRKAWEEGFLNI